MDRPIKTTSTKIIISKKAFNRMCTLVWLILIIIGLFIVK